MKLNAKQLRSGDFTVLPEMKGKNQIYLILDNILDTYNIGAIFRVADSIGAKKVFLCGECVTPPNHRIVKSSVNTTEVVDWEYSETALQAVEKLRSEIKDLKVVAIEQSEGSVLYDKYDYELPIALVLGHESSGVSEEVLKVCDGIVELPMYGVNISMNVMVSLAIISYHILSTLEVDTDPSFK